MQKNRSETDQPEASKGDGNDQKNSIGQRSERRDMTAPYGNKGRLAGIENKLKREDSK